MDLDLRRYWRVVRAYQMPILVITLSAMLSAILLTYVLPEKYEATAVVLVRPSHELTLRPETQQKEVLDFPVSQQAPIDAASKTYIEVIKTRAVTEQIVRALGLHTKVRPTEAQYWKELLFQAKDALKDALDYLRNIAKYGRVETKDPVVKAAEKIEENLEMAPTKDTYVFSITYGAYDRKETAAVANAAADIFIGHISSANEGEARKRREFLEGRWKVVADELAAARRELETFKQERGTFSIRDEHASKLRTIADLEGEYETGQAKLAGLQREYTESHPRVTALLAEQRKRVESIKRLRGGLDALPAQEKQLADLDLKVKVAEEKYEVLAEGYEDARIKEASYISEVRVVSRAEAPVYPSKPIKWKFAAAGAGLGLVSALLLAFFLEFQDVRVRSVDDIRAQLDLPVLATIPVEK
jgi:uncharacterized protein involved in exopolysaccharide biosynthesis